MQSSLRTSPDARAVLVGRVQAALDGALRARMHSHYGDVEIEEITAEGDVLLRFTGFCTSCPARPMTFGTLVLPALEQVPGVRSVRLVGLNMSEAAMRNARRMAQSST